MLAKFLMLLVTATIVVAEIPSYMKVCGRRNPNLDQCVIDSVEGLRDKIRDGMPELDAPSVEPLELSGFPISETDALHAYAANVKLYGLSNFEIKSFHDDLVGQKLEIDMIFKKVILDADYDVKAKIIVPIVGKGPIHIVSEDVHAFVVMKYKLVKKKGGAEYMFFPSMTTTLTVKDYTADFKPAEGPQSTIATAINSALEGGRQEILETIRPTLERVISEEVLKLANKVCQHFTYDELHPDRE